MVNSSSSEIAVSVLFLLLVDRERTRLDSRLVMVRKLKVLE